MRRITPSSVPHAVMRGLLLLVIAILITALALFFAIPSVRGQQPDTLLASIAPPVGVQSQANLGYRVAEDGRYVVAGAVWDDTGATNAGSAYDLNSSLPAEPVVTLNDFRPATYDRFGSSFAIEGTTVAISTPGEHAVMPDKGAVDVFAPANPDFDGDGVLDLRKHAPFGSITAHTALDDTGDDGRKELLELVFNTSPLFSDPAAAPTVASEGGFLTITLSKRAGVSYTVESAGSPDDAAFSMATTPTITNKASTLIVSGKWTQIGARTKEIAVECSVNTRAPSKMLFGLTAIVNSTLQTIDIHTMYI